MREIQNFFRMTATAIVVLIANTISGQSIDEARTLFNEGVTAKNEGNLELMVQKFQDFIWITDQLSEDETYEIIGEINSVKAILPQKYLELSTNKLKEKDFQSGLDYALKSKQTAEKYNDSEILGKSKEILSKIYYNNGVAKYKTKNYNEAILELDKAINENVNNLKAHDLKLKILKEQENDALFIAASKEAIAVATNINDSTAKESFLKSSSTYFLKKGNDAKSSLKYDEAITMLNLSLEFNPENPDAYYLLTLIYNSKSSWDKSIASADDGLKFEAEGNRARFYYELGNAYFGKGNNTAACEAYSKAAVGEYAENAKYQMEHVVKCE